MTKRNTYEHILFPGIVHVTGMPDVGKTTFALECGAPPEKICFIDDDVKGKATALELEKAGHPFGKFVDLTAETEGLLETDFHKYVIDLIESIEIDQYEVIIFDNFSRFENSFHPWVLTHQKEFKTNWSPMGSIHGSEIWLKAFDYEATVLDKMQERAPLVILTSHMKNENISGRRTGKMVPDIKRPILQKSLFRVLLRRSDDGSPIPTGIILKRIAKKVVTDSGIKVMNILPTKVPHITWDKIRAFYENPVGDRKPLPEEILSDHEMSMLDSSILTDDQRFVMEFIAEASKEVDEEESDGQAVLREQMLEMKNDGESLLKIADAFDTDVKTVVQLLKGE